MVRVATTYRADACDIETVLLLQLPSLLSVFLPSSFSFPFSFSLRVPSPLFFGQAPLSEQPNHVDRFASFLPKHVGRVRAASNFFERKFFITLSAREKLYFPAMDAHVVLV